MEYQTYFDVIQSGYRYWWFPAAGLIFVVIGTFLCRMRQLPHGTPEWFPRAILIFSIFWTVFALLSTYTSHVALASALRDGHFKVAEGEITDFYRMPAAGKGDESFSVGGKQFKYSDHMLSAGFNQTSARGGPIRPGLRVRVSYVGDDIARLEIAPGPR